MMSLGKDQGILPRELTIKDHQAFSSWRRYREEIPGQTDRTERAKTERQTLGFPENWVPILLIFLDAEYLPGDWKYVVCSGNR